MKISTPVLNLYFDRKFRACFDGIKYTFLVLLLSLGSFNSIKGQVAACPLTLSASASVCINASATVTATLGGGAILGTPSYIISGNGIVNVT